MNQPAIVPYASLDQLQLAAADAICELVTKAARQQEVVSISLSGGSTPKRLYELLAERDLPWSQIHWFWGDERNVPRDHQESNFRMAFQALLNRVAVPKANIHAVAVDVNDPQSAAQAYESDLRRFFVDQSFPQWDLALLGMGDDAHTASLFPATKALAERERWFVENWVEKLGAYRYTLTVPAINSAHQTWFLVSGESKRDALSHVLGEQNDPDRYPSQLIHATRWFVSRDVTG